MATRLGRGFWKFHGLNGYVLNLYASEVFSGVCSMKILSLDFGIYLPASLKLARAFSLSGCLASRRSDVSVFDFFVAFISEVHVPDLP